MGAELEVEVEFQLEALESFLDVTKLIPKPTATPPQSIPVSSPLGSIGNKSFAPTEIPNSDSSADNGGFLISFFNQYWRSLNRITETRGTK